MFATPMQLAVMAAFFGCATILKCQTIHVVLRAFDALDESDEEEREEASGATQRDDVTSRAVQASIISVILTFMLQLCQEVFMVLTLPESHSVIAIGMTVVFACLGTIEQAFLLDDEWKQKWAATYPMFDKVLPWIDPHQDFFDDVPDGWHIEHQRNSLVFAMTILANIFGHIGGLILIPVLFWGPQAEFYMLSYAPERNIRATMILCGIETIVITVVLWVTSLKLLEKTNMNCFSEATALIWLNKGLIGCIGLTAIMFPAVTLGEQWQVVWFYKVMLNYYGKH